MNKLKFPNKRLVLVASVILCLGLIAGALIAQALTPSSTFWISPGVYPGAPSYTVWREESNYFSKDALGHLVYEGTNASRVVIDTINAEASVTRSGSIFFKAAQYYFDTVLTLTNATILLGEHPSFGSDGGIMDYGTQFTKSLTMAANSPVINVTGDYVRIENIQINSAQAFSTLLEIRGSMGFYNNLYVTGEVLMESSSGDSKIQNSFYHSKFSNLRMIGIASDGVNDNRFYDMQLTWSHTDSEYALYQYYASGNSFYTMRINSASTSETYINITNSDRNLYSGLYFDSGGIGMTDIWLSAASYDNTFIITNSESNTGEITFLDNGYGNYWVDRGYLTLPNQPHPTTTAWGTMEQGRIWFCTTHYLVEYWNSTHVVTP